MKISQITTNYYNAPIKNKNNLHFTQADKRNENPSDGYKRALRISAAASMACLAIAYGGGKIMLEQHRDRMNEILDRHEQEMIELQRSIEKSYQEYKKAYEDYEKAYQISDTINFDTDLPKMSDY
ncbi:MAG: hypothetical protein NC191_01430 [Muribaculaceae bacterium]|nr:hypothetical protein [Muribaculaceae bacterium]